MNTFSDIAIKYLEGTKKSYVVTKKITDNVFKIKDVFKPNRSFILKIILDKTHPLYKMGVENGSRRTVSFHIFLQNYNISPKVEEYGKIEGGYALILEYINNRLDLVSIKDNLLLESINSKIKEMHEMGIVHGDLHSNNIRYRKVINIDTGEKTFNVYFIDFDTSFFLKEYEMYNFPKKWLEYGFDMTSLEEFIEHEKIQYKSIVDDD